jgi:hypothetical protein
VQTFYVRCPLCGARLWVPITLELTPQDTLVDIRFDEVTFWEVVERHMAFNPDLHPEPASD